MNVIKRNGKKEPFNYDKIERAVGKAFASADILSFSDYDKKCLKSFIMDNMKNQKGDVSIELIQDYVENFLMRYFPSVAKPFILYREKHKESRFIRERLDYMQHYTDSDDNAATASETDPNANVTQKNVANLEGEVYKEMNRTIQRQRMKDELQKLYPEVADQYEKDLEHHIIYTNDEASTPTLKFYCQAVSLYPLMLDGVGNIDGITPSAPNDLQSFSGQITNLTFLLSSQCKGAVAFGEYFIALNYYVIKEFGPHWYQKLDSITTTVNCLTRRTIRDNILKAFKQFIYGINQPAGNRSYQSPFTNISYYDHTYFTALFKDFYYPDGTQPEWLAIDTLQRMFMKFFNKLRTKQILTFPVETMAMVYSPETNDIIDKDYKDLTAEMYAEGHSFFTYISDSADSLASCCFSKDTKVLWKNSFDGVKLTTFKELHDLKWEPYKKNLKVYHNGTWVGARSIKLPNRKMYKVKTQNNKEFIISDNHINLTYRGEIATSELTVGDYLMFNTKALEDVKENDEHLTYEQGLLIGLFIGDGTFGNYTCLDGSVHSFTLSLNEKKWNKVKSSIEKLGTFSLGSVYNNVYPVNCNSKELTTFIAKWTGNEPGRTSAINKSLNLNCLLQSKDFRQGILDGWYITDGGNSNRCYTVSKTLVDAMEILCTSLGKQCIVNVSDRTDEEVVIRGEHFSRNYPLYCLRWYSETNSRVRPESGFKWKNNSIYWKITSIEEVEYSDEIYCFEMKNQDEPYFTLPSGLITHNCRLRNELAENTFSPTSGLTGVMTGSCNVITLNVNRIVQDWSRQYKYQGSIEDGFELYREEDKQDLKQYLVNILNRVYKYHIAFKTMLYEMEDKKMFAACNGGYIHMSKLYSTVGLNGLNEAAKFVCLEVGNNPEYIKFLQFILGTVKEQNKLHSVHDKKRPFLFNSEVIPAEGLGGKNYRWDKADGYYVPDDENLYNSYFYDAHDDTSVLDKFILHGRRTYQYTDGGSAAHINLEDHLSKTQYLRLIDFAIKEGTSYFTFNIPNSKCDDCGYITKHPITECPKCHSHNITQYTRVIG